MGGFDDPVPSALTDVTSTCVVSGPGACSNQSAGNFVSSFVSGASPTAIVTVTITGTIAPGTSGEIVNTAILSADFGLASDSATTVVAAPTNTPTYTPTTVPTRTLTTVPTNTPVPTATTGPRAQPRRPTRRRHPPSHRPPRD